MTTLISIIFSLLSATFYGLESGVTKHLCHIKTSYIVFSRSIVSLFFSIILLFIFKDRITFDLLGIIYSLGISFLYFGGLYFFLRSLSKGRAGIMISINSSRIIIVVLASYVFFSHAFSINNILSILVIVAGMLLVGIDSISTKKITTVDGLKEGILSVIFGGIAATLVKIPVSIVGVYLYAVIVQFMFLIFSYLLAKKDIENNGFKEEMYKHRYTMFIIGLFAFLGFFFFNQAIYFGDPSLVNGIMAGQIIAASLYEYIVFKNRLGKFKYLGILLVFIGIFTLAYYW